MLSWIRWFKVGIASLVHVLIIWLRLAELVIVSVILRPALRCTSRWVEDLGAGRHVKSRLLSWRLLNWLLSLGWCCSRWLEGGRRLEFLHRAHHCSEGIASSLLCKWVTRCGLRRWSRDGCSRLGSCGDRRRLKWCLLGGFRHALEGHRS